MKSTQSALSELSLWAYHTNNRAVLDLLADYREVVRQRDALLESAKCERDLEQAFNPGCAMRVALIKKWLHRMNEVIPIEGGHDPCDYKTVYRFCTLSRALRDAAIEAAEGDIELEQVA